MNAETLTTALDGAWNGRSGLGLCPSHPDRHPSLSITDKNGRLVFVCRAGCSQGEVIAALRARGLWAPESQSSRPIVAPFPASAFHEPTAPACCFESPPRCEHWRRFDEDMCVARLHANLSAAAAEVVALFKTARWELSRAELRSEIELIIEVVGSAIVPFQMTADTVDRMISVVVTEVLGNATTRAA